MIHVPARRVSAVLATVVCSGGRSVHCLLLTVLAVVSIVSIAGARALPTPNNNTIQMHNKHYYSIGGSSTSFFDQPLFPTKSSSSAPSLPRQKRRKQKRQRHQKQQLTDSCQRHMAKTRRRKSLLDFDAFKHGSYRLGQLYCRTGYHLEVHNNGIINGTRSDDSLFGRFTFITVHLVLRLVTNSLCSLFFILKVLKVVRYVWYLACCKKGYICRTYHQSFWTVTLASYSCMVNHRGFVLCTGSSWVWVIWVIGENNQHLWTLLASFNARLRIYLYPLYAKSALCVVCVHIHLSVSHIHRDLKSRMQSCWSVPVSQSGLDRDIMYHHFAVFLKLMLDNLASCTSVMLYVWL